MVPYPKWRALEIYTTLPCHPWQSRMLSIVATQCVCKASLIAHSTLATRRARLWPYWVPVTMLPPCLWQSCRCSQASSVERSGWQDHEQDSSTIGWSSGSSLCFSWRRTCLEEKFACRSHLLYGWSSHRYCHSQDYFGATGVRSWWCQSSNHCSWSIGRLPSCNIMPITLSAWASWMAIACVLAPKCFVTCKQWPQRPEFLEAVRKAIEETTFGVASYYPGTTQVMKEFEQHYPHAERIRPTSTPNEPTTDVLWIANIDNGSYGCKREAFCQVFCETNLDCEPSWVHPNSHPLLQHTSDRYSGGRYYHWSQERTKVQGSHWVEIRQCGYQHAPSHGLFHSSLGLGW